MSLPGLSSVCALVSGAVGGSSGSSLGDWTVSSVGSGTRAASFRLAPDGNAYAGDNGAYSTLQAWLLSGVASDFAAYALLDSGAASGTFGAEVSLSSNVTWTATDASSGGSPVEAVITLEIRNAVTHVVIDTATITLEANRIP